MSSDYPAIGWREWVALPDLGIPRIKAKIDTGARTSTLHAFEVESYEEGGLPFVAFKVHPIQKRDDYVVECRAPVADVRNITDSGGHKEERFIITTNIQLGGIAWNMEMTLTNRDTMQFRMLLGRTALKGRFIVDPAHSFLLSSYHEKTAFKQKQ